MHLEYVLRPQIRGAEKRKSGDVLTSYGDCLSAEGNKVGEVLGHTLTMKWIIGVDEAGRGPIAGPISVGVCAIPLKDNVWEKWEGLKDSKKLSEKKREEWYGRIKDDTQILYACAMVSAHIIDEKGIVYAARLAAKRAIGKLGFSPKEARVVLDKNLSVPNFWQQEEFVKGDERIPVIALASIVAKVTRDRYMKKIAKQYPEYGFEIHKGYGTVAHYNVIKKHELSEYHRKTFCN